MDDFLNNLFPEGEARWIKVKYLDANKASKFIRFNSKISGFNNDNLGIEVINIGVNNEYTPQIESLLELKSDFSDITILPAEVIDILNSYIDKKIENLCNKYIASKK